jgi:hypothetical protein
MRVRAVRRTAAAAADAALWGSTGGPGADNRDCRRSLTRSRPSSDPASRPRADLPGLCVAIAICPLVARSSQRRPLRLVVDTVACHGAERRHSAGVGGRVHAVRRSVVLGHPPDADSNAGTPAPCFSARPDHRIWGGARWRWSSAERRIRVRSRPTRRVFCAARGRTIWAPRSGRPCELDRDGARSVLTGSGTPGDDRFRAVCWRLVGGLPVRGWCTPLSLSVAVRARFAL